MTTRLSRLWLRLEVAAARTWRFTVCAFALWGAAVTLGLVLFGASLWFYPESTRCYARPAPSPVAARLARKIAPELQVVANEYKPTFIAHAGNALERTGARLAYPVVVREIPTAAEVGCDHLLSHFGRMPLSELVELVVDHETARGELAHPSLLFFRHGRGQGAAP